MLRKTGPMPERVTLAAVAADAGVSVGTASRALSGRGDLAAGTRRRVLASALALGYARDPAVGGRPPGSARLVDLVLGRYHTAYSDEVTAGARSAAAAAGYDLVLAEERDSPDDDWPLRVRRRGSAGVVLGLISPTAAQLAALTDAGIPVVLMDPRAETSRGLTSVRTTDREGGAAAAQHLVERGATRFAIVLGSPPYRYGRARNTGFRETLRLATPGADLVALQADWGRRARARLRSLFCAAFDPASGSGCSRAPTRWPRASTPPRPRRAAASPMRCSWWASTICAARGG